MAYQESLWDKLTSALYPVMRTLNDVNINLMGSKSLVLKIDRADRGKSLWRDEEDTLMVSFIGNSLIRYPSDSVELFQTRDPVSMDSEVKSIDLEEILPIEMIMKWEGEVDEDPVELARGDIIVDVHYGDTASEKILIVLEVERIRGYKFGKYVVQKICELSLYRGTLYNDVQIAVNNYLDSL